MARARQLELITNSLMRDPRLRTLPAAARMLWFELVMAMRAAGVSVLRFGGQIPDATSLVL